MRISNLAALVLALTLATAAPLRAQAHAWADNAPEDARPLLGQIDRFLAAPFAHPELRLPLLDSAEARPDVAITISEPVVPYLLESSDPAAASDTTQFRAAMRALFLTVFVAGNMDEQLRTGVKGDHPYAGTKHVVRVYQMVRARQPDYRHPVLDAWVRLDQQNKLEEFIAAEAARAKRESDR